ncbi:MAG: FapA family protein [Treponema sp.]
MIEIEQIKQKMSELHEEDSGRFFVEVEGSSLDEALSNAATQLGVSKSRIDYEVVQKGVQGVFALFPKKWRLIAYELARNVSKIDTKIGEDGDESGVEQTQVIETKDGDAFVFRAPDGVYLKVIPPKGEGKPAGLNTVIEKFNAKALPIPNEEVIAPVLTAASAEYVKVAPYDRVLGHDATMAVEISEDEMKAYLYVLPPTQGGIDLSSDTIVAFLKNNRVIVGINEEYVSAFQDSPVYKENYLVAEGILPKHGADAKIKYNFEVDNTHVRLKETKSGQINFKELNLIENVVVGQPLAQKIPAERGQGGKTVTGKYLEANNGKDIPLPLGKNTELADDGLTILATVSGQVLLVKNKINVEEVHVVEGDVSIKTGDFTFLGTVIVNGNVDDGYSIKASGNIEVKGTVGAADLDAEGDIVVGQGIVGKDSGNIRAGKSIWSKFIQNTKKVEAGDMVIVTDGIMNSNVMANRKIICRGKKGNIIGGELSASESVSAKTIGSKSAGNDTVISVGFDPKSKERLNFLLAKQDFDGKNLSDVKLNLRGLEETKKRRGGLPTGKEEAYQKLLQDKRTLETEVQRTEKEIEQIKSYLDGLKNDGRVSASGDVYAGVRIVIRDSIEDVRSDCKAVTFYLDNGFVRYGKYQDDDQEDAKKVPSGYSAD